MPVLAWVSRGADSEVGTCVQGKGEESLEDTAVLQRENSLSRGGALAQATGTLELKGPSELTSTEAKGLSLLTRHQSLNLCLPWGGGLILGKAAPSSQGQFLGPSGIHLFL